jgi:phosphatidate cytidylyltransferase
LYTCNFFRNEGDYKIFLLILITCISTDIGGYVFGKILKGPKLTKISPNKTYAGMMGSFLLSIISASLYFDNLSFFSLSKTDGELGIQIMIIVLLISFVSQSGDLVISFFKRKSKIKNTSNIIPGHGGLLDRIDGMIFAFPFTYILLKIL